MWHEPALKRRTTEAASIVDPWQPGDYTLAKTTHKHHHRLVRELKPAISYFLLQLLCFCKWLIWSEVSCFAFSSKVFSVLKQFIFFSYICVCFHLWWNCFIKTKSGRTKKVKSFFTFWFFCIIFSDKCTKFDNFINRKMLNMINKWMKMIPNKSVCFLRRSFSENCYWTFF